MVKLRCGLSILILDDRKWYSSMQRKYLYMLHFEMDFANTFLTLLLPLMIPIYLSLNFSHRLIPFEFPYPHTRGFIYGLLNRDLSSVC